MIADEAVKPFRVSVREELGGGYFVYVDDGTPGGRPVAFCLTRMGAYWKASRVLRKLRRHERLTR